MFKIVCALVLSAFALAAPAARTYFDLIEHAAEVERLELSPNPGQLLYARRCDECQTLALSVDADSQIFDGRRPITLSTAAGYSNRGGTVLFDPKTRRVTRIVFWPEIRTTP